MLKGESYEEVDPLCSTGGNGNACPGRWVPPSMRRVPPDEDRRPRVLAHKPVLRIVTSLRIIISLPVAIASIVLFFAALLAIALADFISGKPICQEAFEKTNREMCDGERIKR